MNEYPALSTLIPRLVAEDLVKDEDLPAIRRVLETPLGPPRSPWYLRILIGVGAFTVAILLVILLGMAGIVTSGESAAAVGFVLGFVAVVLKLNIDTAARGEFSDKLALALVLTGQLLVIAGVGVFSESVLVTATVTLLLEVLLLGIYPDRLQRFLSTLASGGALAAMLQEISVPFANEVTCILLLALAASIWLDQARIRTGPLQWLDPAAGYGALVAAFAILLLGEFAGGVAPLFRVSNFIVTAGLTLCLLGIVYRVLRELPKRPAPRTSNLIFVGTLLLGAVTHSAPGIVAALAALLIGFHRRDSRLTGLGVLFLVTFGIVFYYQLELTLLSKSATLFASGVALLALRWLLRRLPAPGEA